MTVYKCSKTEGNCSIFEKTDRERLVDRVFKETIYKFCNWCNTKREIRERIIIEL